jgi:hypothetical protein
MGRPFENVFSRFWKKTKKQGSCLIWIGSKYSGDRGSFTVAVPGENRRICVMAHRWIYQQVFGPLPRSTVLLHSCDVSSCVALQHLSPGSQRQNIRDCIDKGRFAYADRMPHSKLTFEQVKEIRRLREKNGLSQQKLADRFGVSRELVRDIVLGRKRNGH